MTKARHYKMTVAGQLFRHLGLQMYSGAVPALAELISNAYDAMARNVFITLPIGRAIENTDDIVVSDDGHGMTFDESNDLYLTVGRDQRHNWHVVRDIQPHTKRRLKAAQPGRTWLALPQSIRPECHQGE